MNFTLEPETVAWPESHFIFVERIGPFQSTAPQAWKELHLSLPTLVQENQLIGFASHYKIGPLVYRAGASLAAPPVELPENLQYEVFKGGLYSRFVLTGPYSFLPEATARAFQIASERKIQFRDDYCIENYVNSPNTTPDAQLITEILFPVVE